MEKIEEHNPVHPHTIAKEEKLVDHEGNITAVHKICIYGESERELRFASDGHGESIERGTIDLMERRIVKDLPQLIGETAVQATAA